MYFHCIENYYHYFALSGKLKCIVSVTSETDILIETAMILTLPKINHWIDVSVRKHTYAMHVNGTHTTYP